MTIETPTLILIPGTKELFTCAIAGDDQLSAQLGFHVAANWTEFGNGPLEYALHRITEHPEEKGWWTYFPVHKADRLLIGSCGYKGPFSEEGTVEIGYEVSPSYRNKGLATEIANGLIKHAFSFSQVKSVLAHTLAEENASVHILRKCGFVKTAEINDPEDGVIWRWELQKK
ncbi:MAG: GNAT family N-acetyltransferase [Chitinophagaceae bacterium]